MKWKMLVSLLSLSSLLAFKLKNTPFDFSGKWHSEMPTWSFDLNLTQLNNKLTGSHCAVLNKGDKIDCVFEDTDISLSGFVGNSSSVIVTFKSQVSNKTGSASISKINDTTIAWKIIRQPDGVFYIPEHAQLNRNTH